MVKCFYFPFNVDYHSTFYELSVLNLNTCWLEYFLVLPLVCPRPRSTHRGWWSQSWCRWAPSSCLRSESHPPSKTWLSHPTSGPSEVASCDGIQESPDRMKANKVICLVYRRIGKIISPNFSKCKLSIWSSVGLRRRTNNIKWRHHICHWY